MTAREYLWLLNLIACAALTGLIWLVQLVHYPSFRFVAPARFAAFHHFHSLQISYIVAPLMFVELMAAMGYVMTDARGVVSWVNLASVLAVWLVTFLVSVPLHGQLAQGFSLTVVDKLIASNWLRTMLWTARLLMIATVWLLWFAPNT